MVIAICCTECACTILHHPLTGKCTYTCMTNFRPVDNAFSIFAMLSGRNAVFCLLVAADWVIDDKAGLLSQLWLSVSLYKQHCVFLPFPVSPSLPPTPFRSGPPEASPVPSADTRFPLSISHAMSWIFMCSCQKQPLSPWRRKGWITWSHDRSWHNRFMPWHTEGCNRSTLHLFSFSLCSERHRQQQDYIIITSSIGLFVSL